MSISVVINAHEWNSIFFRGLNYVNSRVEGARETVRMAGELQGSTGSSRSQPRQVKDAQGECEAAQGAWGGLLRGFGSDLRGGCSPVQLVSVNQAFLLFRCLGFSSSPGSKYCLSC